MRPLGGAADSAAGPVGAAQHEHEFEAAPGLPEPLPRGEHLLWQGAPDARALARDAFHLRLLGGYFAALLAWRAGVVLADGGGVPAAARAVLWLLPLALLALGMLAGLAWLAGRTTVYTITDRRVVMRIGIVLTVTFNLPFRRIQAVALAARRDGTGNIVLSLEHSDKIAYLNLWPHARPWRLAHPEPMLRAIPAAATVAATLAAALNAATGATAAAAPASPLRADENRLGEPLAA